MNIIRSRLIKYYPKAILTYGYVTSENRNHLTLDKTHNIDACVIASGGNNFSFTTNLIYYKRCVNRGDYQRTKGIRSEKTIPKGKIYGFKKFDKVKYLGKKYFIKGRRTSGWFVLSDIFGNPIITNKQPKGIDSVKATNCIKIGSRRGVLIQQNFIKGVAIPLNNELLSLLAK